MAKFPFNKNGTLEEQNFNENILSNSGLIAIYHVKRVIYKK